MFLAKGLKGLAHKRSPIELRFGVGEIDSGNGAPPPSAPSVPRLPFPLTLMPSIDSSPRGGGKRGWGHRGSRAGAGIFVIESGL
jgi:hypothetical protein